MNADDRLMQKAREVCERALDAALAAEPDNMAALGLGVQATQMVPMFVSWNDRDHIVSASIAYGSVGTANVTGDPVGLEGFLIQPESHWTSSDEPGADPDVSE